MQKVKESDDQRKGIEHDRQAGLPEDGEESNREMAEGLEGKTEEQLEEEAEKSEDESEIRPHQKGSGNRKDSRNLLNFR